ncbi:MAG: DUF3021 domain-containing protein [Ruminiclostridium sp.]|nr:DUF3021 domain-containing protein [Ruminiclostridium sp.]
MIKKAGIRAAHGFAYGVLAGQIVMILISLSLEDGKFFQFVPKLRALFNNEIEAVIAQTVLTGIIGTVFAAASLVFEIEKWSILKQCVIHFLITAAFWVPIAYLFWLPQNIQSIIICFAGFLVTYVINWLIQYFISRNDVKKINAKIGFINKQNKHD